MTAIPLHHFQKFSILVLVALFVFLIVPRHVSAAEATALLGGGNALAHATTGVQHANPRSSIMEHLLFASTRGGKPDLVPPSASSTEATSDDQGNDEDSSGDSANSNSAGGPSTGSTGSPQAGSGSSSNGGASGGNGGNGGSAAPGGLVRAGSVVSNATAVNVLNTIIVRIGSR